MNGVYMDSWALFDGLAIGRLATIIAVAVIAAIALTFVILRGVALLKFVKNNHIAIKILAFVPIAQSFVLGMVSDNIKKEATGKTCINRYIMPAVYAIKWAAFVSFIVVGFGIINNYFSLCQKYPDWIPVDSAINLAFTFILPVAITIGLAIVFAIPYKVLYHVAHYRIYKESNKDTASSLSSISILGGSIFSLVFLFNAKVNAVKEESVVEVANF